ncbi:MAG: lipid-A-disaccharide synthase [Deltaproteobacteria bacterium]|nr:lipid-A-disaccharide synthase [Deltaproteobacteria bacterium]
MDRGVSISRASAEKSRSGRILIVAGEASADIHGANLVRAVHRLDPEVAFQGIGGPRMAGAGAQILIPSSEMAVVGLTEVIPRLAGIRSAARRIKRILQSSPPDLLILLDYPEFNLHLAGIAKRCGVPVLYYISPQIWAWRRGRIRKIARRVDRMAVILPFEESVYRRTGVPVTYVGHPLLDAVPDGTGGEEARRRLGVGPDVPLLGILPGSRDDEVDNLLPGMLRAAEILHGVWPGLRCVLPVASTVSHGRIEDRVRDSSVQVNLWRDDMHMVLPGCDAALVASGTATLETAIHYVPMVIAYRVSPLSYRIAKAVVRVPFIGLVNLVAGREVVPELVQDKVTPAGLAREAARFLAVGPYRENVIKELKRVQDLLGGGGASERTAEVALRMMGRMG